MGDGDKQIKYINVGMEFTNKVCKKILENLEGDERDAQLEIMKNTMKDYIKMEREYKVSKSVLERLRRGLEMEAADMDRNIEADYQAELNSQLEKERIGEGSLEADHRYRQLESLIGGQSGDNQDLMVTAETKSYIDPFTRKCGHTFEKEIVNRFLENSAKKKKTLQCPVVGCNNSITQGDLYPDTEARRKIMKQNRT